MSKDYTNEATAKAYRDFTNSENGKIQQSVLFEALRKHVDTAPGSSVLDVACGGGWLAGKLSEIHIQSLGCDYSPTLISFAKQQFPTVSFEVADVTNRLPYRDGQFSTVIFNMAAHDVSNLKKAFAEISRVTEEGGKVLVTIANPYYSFPVGVWKRGIIRLLLGMKPVLLLRPFSSFKKLAERKFTWNGKFSSYFHTVPEYISASFKAGLQLNLLEDIETENDSKNFNMQYQLHRFPVIMLLVFKKTTK